MRSYNHLNISGILFTAVVFLWPLFMVLFRLPEDIGSQFSWIREHPLEYKIQFFFAFLISPSVLYLMYAQLDNLPEIKRLRMIPGTIFLTGYFILSSISYASQMTILPKFLHGETDQQAILWYFNSPDSMAYFLNQLGYCFWGIGTLVLFSQLIGEKSIIKYISVLYVISAILSIIAFAGLILDNDHINSMTLYSGLVLTPTGILSIIWGFSIKRKIQQDVYAARSSN